MTRAFVVDASVALGRGAPRPGHAADREDAGRDRGGRARRGAGVVARRGRERAHGAGAARKLTSADHAGAPPWLRRLPVRLDHEMAGLAFSALASLAVEHELSVYDAAYLELAQRRRLPLGCKDGPLRKAARRRGVPLVE